MVTAFFINPKSSKFKTNFLYKQKNILFNKQLISEPDKSGRCGH